MRFQLARRVAGTWNVLFVVASLSGCAMCQDPFDYCNPVVGPGGCVNCEFGARRGSVFAPMEGDSALAAMDPTPVRQEPSSAELSEAGYRDDGTDDREMADTREEAGGSVHDPGYAREMANLSDSPDVGDAADDDPTVTPAERTAGTRPNTFRR